MKRIALLLPLVCLVASGQITHTPNLDMNLVGAHTPLWNIPFNQNTVKLDTIFGGAYPVPGALFVSFLGIPKGATNPATCVVGQIFFNTSATAGQNLYGCTATNTWTQQAGGGGGGAGTVTSVAAPSGSWPTWLVPSVTNPTTTPSLSTSFILGNFPTLNQNTTGNAATATALAANPVDCPGSQFANAIAANGDLTCAVPAGGGNVNNTGTPTSGQLALWTASTVIQGVTTLPAANFPAQTGDITNSAGSLATTLAAVGSAGSCGDSTHSCQLTFDTKGRETARANVAIAGVGGAASAITSGVLGSLPGTCAAGDVYFATNQPAGQQLYQCSAANTWTQTFLTDTTLTNTAGAFGVDLAQFCRRTNSCTVAALWDFGGAAATAPLKKGLTSALPGTCAVGQEYFATDATAGQNEYYCTATNTWTQQSGGGSVTTHWVLATRSVTQSIPTGLSLTNILYDTNDASTTNAALHSTSSNTQNFVADATGFWQGNCEVSTQDNAVSMAVVVFANGVAIANGGAPSTVSQNTGWQVNVPWSVHLTSGDIVKCQAESNTGFTSVAGVSTQFWMTLIH